MNRIGELEFNYIKEVLDTQFRSSKGANMMKRLEEKFSQQFGGGTAIAMVNGTATMHAALEAAGIGPGDEVIVPPLTMASTAFCVLQANATPVFADVDPDTFQICSQSIEKNITKNTRAIITVALYGLSPDMDPIMTLAKKHSLIVIEDNAECFLGFYKGKVVGSIGDFASFSFQSSKHLTAGEGGILLSNNKDYSTRCRLVQSLGYGALTGENAKITKADIQSPEYFRHINMGWNYRMSELCCAVALAQTERISALVDKRKLAGQKFNEILSDASQLVKLQEFDSGVYEHSYWAFPFVLNTDRVSWKDFRVKFMANGGDAFYGAWQLTYNEPCFKTGQLLGRENFISKDNLNKYKFEKCKNAEHIQPKLIALKTNYWNDTDLDVQLIALNKTIKELL